MKTKPYDIFISYRRAGGAQYARILQLMLQQRGYNVFLDYDELTDGVFGDHIKAAIKEAPVFMLILSERSMNRCLNENDWVRQEILLAIRQGKHLIPVNPDNSFDGFPADTETQHLPPEIRNQISSHQFSEINFGQTLGVTLDLMIKNRIVPTLGERNAAEHIDTDFSAAQETLAKQEKHNRFMKRLGVAGVLAVVLMVLGTCGWFYLNRRASDSLEQLRTELQEKHRNFGLQFSSRVSREQMLTVDAILMNMVPVRPDTLWMSQFEFTVGEWNGITGASTDANQGHMPKTNVSFGEIYMFLVSLGDMTNIGFELPSEPDWDYAARGGGHPENTTYVGSDDLDAVAWYRDNSGGSAHPSDGQQGKDPNGLDLYDMSGNVSELCNSPFGESGLYVIRGGSYDSPASEVTVSSRKGFDTSAKDQTVGFRIIVRKP